MEIQLSGGIPAPFPHVGTPQTTARKTEETGKTAAAATPERDTLELSEQAEEWLNRANAAAPEKSPQDSEPNDGESTSIGGSVGINAAKLARMLAQARTKGQVQAVIAQIQQDLRECESGRAQGMDVDEASVQAAENLLNQARQRMGQAKDGEATPEEETAFSLASLL